MPTRKKKVKVELEEGVVAPVVDDDETEIEISPILAKDGAAPSLEVNDVDEDQTGVNQRLAILEEKVGMLEVVIESDPNRPFEVGERVRHKPSKLTGTITEIRGNNVTFDCSNDKETMSWRRGTFTVAFIELERYVEADK